MKRTLSLAAMMASLALTTNVMAQEAGQPLPGGEPPPPSAENTAGANYHDGFYLRLGANFGPQLSSQKFEFGNLESDASVSGFTYGFDLMIGGTPVDGLAIGGALITALTPNPKVEDVEQDATVIMSGIAAFADYYFNPSEGLHAQVLLGFAAVDAVSDSGQSGGNDPTGFMLGAGVGYDFWIGDEWSIGPLARVIYAPTSTSEGNATYKYNYLWPSIGVGITLH